MVAPSQRFRQCVIQPMHDPMAENRIGFGHLIGGVGAVIALVSLWLPRLKFDLNKLQQEQTVQAALQAGGIPAQIRAEMNRYLAQLPQSSSGNGWDVMQRTDIAFGLAAAAVIALIFASVALGADSRATAKITIF